MSNEFIGKNAGVVWRALHDCDKELTLQELVYATHLDPIEAAAAIGWLSRENKISANLVDNEYKYTVFQECYY